MDSLMSIVTLVNKLLLHRYFNILNIIILSSLFQPVLSAIISRNVKNAFLNIITNHPASSPTHFNASKVAYSERYF